MPQFELGRRLFPTNRRDGLAWYMLANFNQNLDMNECRDLKRTKLVLALLRQYELKIEDHELLLWADALDESLDIATRHGIERRGKQPPWWICAPGEANPSYDRLISEEGRALKRERIFTSRMLGDRSTSIEIRLNVSLNPDHYRLWKLATPFWKGKLNSEGDYIQERYFSAAWIDNDNLLFGGYRILEELGKPHRYDPIYRWNLRTGDITKYAESGFGVCYFKGVISYYVKRDEKLFYREGEMGQERESELSPAQARRIGQGLPGTNARFQCRRFAESESPHSPPLWALESGGKVDLGGRYGDKHRTAKYYPRGASDAVDFDPYEGLQKRAGVQHRIAFPPKYSAYLDGSWFVVGRGRPAPEPVPIWILRSIGDIERYDVPLGPWAGTMYSPAKDGWFTLTRNGLYFLSGNGKAKILAGRAQAIRVSPNGCRAAVSTPQPDGQGDPLWVVDVCQKGAPQ